MSAFNEVAQTYDSTFTNTPVGTAQRDQVYAYLSTVLSTSQACLEINCGTGEDAQWMAPRVKSLLATDVSSSMVKVAKTKKKMENTHFQVLDFLNLHQLTTTFDVVFSNFGGLNCLPPEKWSQFVNGLHQVTSPKAHFIAVIMGKNCWWEKFYFSLKFDFSNAKRRKKEVVSANLNPNSVATYYYSPAEIARFLGADWKVQKVQPIGFLVPPSYLNPFFENKQKMLSVLQQIDTKLAAVPGLANSADHYLIHLEKQ